MLSRSPKWSVATLVVLSVLVIGCGDNLSLNPSPYKGDSTAILKYNPESGSETTASTAPGPRVRPQRPANSDLEVAETPRSEPPRTESSEASALQIKLIKQDGAWQPRCDIYTELMLFFENNQFKARLTDKLGPDSTCYILINPNKREYTLTASAPRCGSITYTGTNDQGDHLTITDHTTRECTDLKPALFEAEEVLATETQIRDYLSIDGMTREPQQLPLP